MILLDTHILLWLAEGNPRISPEVRTVVNQSAHQGELFVSPISIWEIALKRSRGRLELDRPLRLWVRQIMQRSNLQLAPVTTEIACASAELPKEFHGDPADRIIAATARVEQLQLVTADEKLIALAQQSYYQAIAV